MFQLNKSHFGNHFFWGVAIAAAQNEGAWNEGGRGASIWDAFAKQNGKIKGGTKPTINCDFYHRYKDDLLIVKALGFNVFRFSFSWSRIFPDGIGKPNEEGVLFYHKLIDECLLLGLVPFVTLYHWDLPLALEKEGGWTSRLFSKWFAKYVNFCAKEYGNKVKHWIVLNEPMGFTSLGYMLGKHAPGKMGLDNFFAAIHNATLAQADGGRILRNEIKNVVIGTSFSCSEVKSYSSKKNDIEAANRLDILMNRLFIEPTLGMGYPNDEFELMDKLHFSTKAWKYTERMKFDFDFIGLQNYFTITVKHNSIVPYVQASEVTAKKRKAAHTDLGWEINADSFYNMIKRFWAYNGVSQIIITENGACYKDVLENGVINDDKRIAYFQQYIRAMHKAKTEGVNIGGYFAWTLTDNFEWNEGFNARFGLVHVDFTTQLRTIKNSGYWWREFLK